MKKHSRKIFYEIINKKVSHSRWLRVVLVFAVIVDFCTTYSLILPAVTLTNDKAAEEEGFFLDVENAEGEQTHGWQEIPDDEIISVVDSVDITASAKEESVDNATVIEGADFEEQIEDYESNNGADIEIQEADSAPLTDFLSNELSDDVTVDEDSKTETITEQSSIGTEETDKEYKEEDDAVSEIKETDSTSDEIDNENIEEGVYTEEANSNSGEIKEEKVLKETTETAEENTDNAEKDVESHSEETASEESFGSGMLSYSNQGYALTVTYDENAAIPADAYLVVNDAEGNAGEMADTEILFSKFIEVSIECEGELVFPAADVSISLEHDDLPDGSRIDYCGEKQSNLTCVSLPAVIGTIVTRPIAYLEGEVTCESEDFIITASVSTDAKLPENSKLKVVQVDDSSILAKSEDESSTAAWNKTLKISFENEDGAVTPKTAIPVTIKWNAELPKGERKDYIVTEEQLDVTDFENAVKVAEFPVTIGTAVLTERLSFNDGTLSFKGSDYLVEVQYDENSGIPEGAYLDVTEIADYAEYADYLEQAEGELKKSIEKGRFFDISLKRKGWFKTEEIEPTEPVKVSISLDKYDNKNLSVLHFAEDGIVMFDDVETEAIVAPEGDDEEIADEKLVVLNSFSLKSSKSLKKASDPELSITEKIPEGDPVLAAYQEAKNNDKKWEKHSFVTDSFSVYGVVWTTIEKTVLTRDGQAYHITVTYDDNTGIPEEAELKVEEILPEENGDSSTFSAYDEYVSKTETALGMESGSVGYLRLFDIKIVDKDDHSIKYQPDEGTVVDVRIELADIESEDLRVVHFEDGAEEGDKVDAETDGQVVMFEANGFSVYAIVGTTIEKNVLASDGHNYKVTVTYGAEAGIPEGAELEVTEVTSESSVYGKSYEEYVAYTENALGMEEGSAGYIRLFDIKIVDKNDYSVKYQPKEGTTVDVQIELADAEDGKDLSVVHFADGSEEGDRVESNTESAENGQIVSFEAESFSVYGIVDLDSAETASSVAELAGNSYYVSLIDGNNQYYYADPLVLVNNNAWKFQRVTTLDAATRFYFEEAEADEQGNSLCIYILDAEGNKKYVNLHIETNNLRYFELGDSEETATKYTVDIHTAGSPDTFVIYHKEGAKEFYYWNRNGNYFELAKGTGSDVPKTNNTKIILTQIGSDGTTLSDPYGLEGLSLGILWNVNDTSGSAMMSTTGTANSQITPADGSAKVSEPIAILKNKLTTVRVDPTTRTDRVFVAQNSDISTWTFTCCGPAEYYITTVVNEQLKYVRFDDSQTEGTGDKGISLVDEPDERCRITVTEGTGTYSGKYKFSCNGRTLYNNNGNFFTKAETENGQGVWMYFAEQSTLNDDDFVVYTAKRSVFPEPWMNWGISTMMSKMAIR